MTVKDQVLEVPENNEGISLPGIKVFLKPEFQNIPIQLFEKVASTNDTAKELAMTPFSGETVVLAKEQSAGKGRLGRSFFSPGGNGVYMSLLFKPGFDVSKAGLLTTAASVAVAQSIEALTPLTPQIKWVNDVYVNDKKICGILAEAITDFEGGSVDAIVLGIGVNYGNAEFPEELKHTCTSLAIEMQDKETPCPSKNALTAQIINHLIPLVRDLNAQHFLPYYRAHSMVLGREITVYKNGHPESSDGISAKALDIDELGGLKVLYSSGEEETLTSGEISIRLINGRQNI